MVDPGENVSTTLKREFIEEVNSTENLSEEDAKIIHKRIKEFLSSSGKDVSLACLLILYVVLMCNLCYVAWLDQI